LRRIGVSFVVFFFEDTPAARTFKGIAWLFLGVTNEDSMPYRNEILEVQSAFPEKFRFDSALSRKQTNSMGEKMYIQHKLMQHVDEILERMNNGAHMYFCGLKGMMPGIIDVFKNKGGGDDIVQKWKDQKQYHVEVY